MNCESCGAQNKPERRFCTSCGAPLEVACPVCGAATEAGDAFCGECGSRIAGGGRAEPASARSGPSPTAAPRHSPAPTVSELRRVSVLFCDLVGFTTLSESRDPEDVRELLSRYFELARSIIDLYGGSVEKFIGDAVMAVWGVPTANEDDAERAVRAALDLVAGVEQLGATAALPGLAARAGVLTGDAAVTLGASDQGMVAGDVVNTASRLQSAANPGSVLAGEATYLAARDAIAFTEPRELTVKGREEPVRTWRAVRVVAQRRGAGKSTQLEPPFVGREVQLRLLVDLLHSTGRERKARLVSVTGIAGIGKSRLSWELLKYVDGLAETVFWHHGRSPAYGEGITFWALAEMVRMRARISELEDVATARKKLVAAVEEFLDLADERRWIEPCLAHLLGLAEPTTEDRQELFAAWRTFFERIAERGTVVMVFEDLQWADTGLLDFVESVAERSRSYPILVVTLSRPELADRRPSWGAGTRDFTSLHLDPLSDTAMRELLHGLVRGLPEDATEQLVRRADGVPLHAVEMVRSLVDRGVVVQLDDDYELLGEVSELELPDSLQSLIASRLDTLPQGGRSLLQDAAVLGTTFSLAALSAVAALEESSVSEQLHDLVRREFLTINSDPRSPERGQYGFVQSVVREVAYGTLSKRDRRVKHLASARCFEVSGEEELSGLVAAHYLEAYRASGEGADREEIGALARRWLERSAQRALSLGSTEQAFAYAEQALEITPEGSDRASLLLLATKAGRMSLEADRAIDHAYEAIRFHEAAGDSVEVARGVVELIGAIMSRDHGFPEGIEMADRAFAALPETGAEEVEAELALSVSMLHHSLGDNVASLEMADRAIRFAERMDDTSLFARALNSRSAALFSLGRHREAAILQRGVTEIADATGSLNDQCVSRLFESLYLEDDDPRGALRAADESAELSRRAGDRTLESTNVLNAIEMALLVGDWTMARERLATMETNPLIVDLHSKWKEMLSTLLEGMVTTDAHAIQELDRLQEQIGSNDYVHMQGTYFRVRALTLLARGEFEGAVDAVHALLASDPEGINALVALGILGHASLCRHDVTGAREAVDRMASFHGRWSLAARATIRAGITALEGTGVEASAKFREAAAMWEPLDVPLDLALCGMDAAMLLAPEDRPAEVVDQARRIFEDLGAAPFLAQLAPHLGAVTSPAGG
jgi:class 3 adenylate cyclase/tetratricopeptide (TPR) repeat protein